MWEERVYYVYILASRRHGTLYIGVTNSLIARIARHKEGKVAGFTKKYGVTRLVHFEVFSSPSLAIQREKSLKRWPRAWKINLIERENQDWIDLYPTISGTSGEVAPATFDGAYGSSGQARG